MLLTKVTVTSNVLKTVFLWLYIIYNILIKKNKPTCELVLIFKVSSQQAPGKLENKKYY